MDLSNQVALVVGGGSGIGLGIAKALALEGCRIALAGRTEATLIEASASAEFQGQAKCKSTDASDRDAVNELFAWVESELGPIDILVFSAGVNIAKRNFDDMDPDDYDRVMAANAGGAFNCLYAALKSMRPRKTGTIINIVSLAAMNTAALAGLPYTASKYAQSSMGLFANQEANADGVRVTNIHPGEVDTPILEKRPKPVTPEHRVMMLQPEDIAAVAVTVAKLPARAVVPEIVIVPRHQSLG